MTSMKVKEGVLINYALAFLMSNWEEDQEIDLGLTEQEASEMVVDLQERIRATWELPAGT